MTNLRLSLSVCWLKAGCGCGHDILEWILGGHLRGGWHLEIRRGRRHSFPINDSLVVEGLLLDSLILVHLIVVVVVLLVWLLHLLIAFVIRPIIVVHHIVVVHSLLALVVVVHVATWHVVAYVPWLHALPHIILVWRLLEVAVHHVVSLLRRAIWNRVEALSRKVTLHLVLHHPVVLRGVLGHLEWLAVHVVRLHVIVGDRWSAIPSCISEARCRRIELRDHCVVTEWVIFSNFLCSRRCTIVLHDRWGRLVDMLHRHLRLIIVHFGLLRRST